MNNTSAAAAAAAVPEVSLPPQHTMQQIITQPTGSADVQAVTAGQNSRNNADGQA
jgi:hypothetical protein